jgi:hypothetical protein
MPADRVLADHSAGRDSKVSLMYALNLWISGQHLRERRSASLMRTVYLEKFHR